MLRRVWEKKEERKKYVGKVEDFIGDMVACEEIHELLREVVAVVRKKVICFAGKAVAVFFNEPQNDFLGEFRISHRNDLHRVHSKSPFHLH